MVQRKLINYLDKLDKKTGNLHHVRIFGDGSNQLSYLISGKDGDCIIGDFKSLDELENYINEQLTKE